MASDLLKKVDVGIDIVEISRFRKIPYESNKSFYKKIFTLSEIRYCIKYNDPYLHFAGKFAIKEATKKSILKNVKMSDIITSHKKSKPIVAIRNNKHHNFVVSMSHEKTYAIAVVLSIVS